MSAITPSLVLLEARTRSGLSQRALADRAQTAQSVVARIENGQNTPNHTTLARLVAAAGFELSLELKPAAATDATVAVYKSGVDRTLLRENLKRSVEGRVKALAALARLANEASSAGRALRRRQ
jgi:transcriptional regulator with XRE-family HTH domain